MTEFRFPLLLMLVLSLHAAMAHGQSQEKIRFDLQIKPILSNHCWSCHGPDEAGRKGGLRLDQPDSAYAPADSGLTAIVPGQPDSSELLRRISVHDPDLQMPPAAAKKPLTSLQKNLLKQWISEGAEFSSHWAFRSPVRPELPDVRSSRWPKNEIDRFILHRLQEEGLEPSEETPPAVWLRRVTLDLTGLPPSLDELSSFEERLLTEPADAVYQTVVDRLLASPRYGERMAMLWLDAARYADTNGYNNDETRTMWPWRDWVISAFSSGMPYDQFLTEQIAGDLLPDASLSQKVATGFCRNHVLTTEGGIIEEEYRVEYVADRVHTTATVFMAMSMQCARCHDHKYDPISQREYYQFAAFFNNVPDKVVSYNQTRMAEPLLKVPSAEQTAELERLAARTSEINAQLKTRSEVIDAELAAWESSLSENQKQTLSSTGLKFHFPFEESEGMVVHDRVSEEPAARIAGNASRVDGRLGRALKFDGSGFVESAEAGQFDSTDPFSISVWILLTSTDPCTVVSRMDEAAAYRGYDLIMEGARPAAHFVHAWPGEAFKIVGRNAVSLNEWHHLVVSYDGTRRASGVRLFVDGVPQEVVVTTDNELSGTLMTDKPFHIGRRQTSAPFQGLIDDVRLYAGVVSAEDAKQLSAGQDLSGLADVLVVPDDLRTPQQRDRLRSWYVTHVDPVAAKLREELQAIPERTAEIEKTIPATMVMAEPAEPRPAFVLKRGQYDQPAEQVEAEFPATLSGNASPRAADVARRLNRLDLARWLTHPDHPLTARVAVNRWWEMLFGTGLVETSDDFGIQGAMPSHPELLDWLATELIQENWDQRAILKKIVLSAAYRQSSAVSSQWLERDPANRLLGRGPRYRLPAETLRDSALFVSGLLREHIGGPSVKPWQPEGLWEDVSVERRDKYVVDTGDGLYRRGMYTFWKRTCPPPGMSTFDAPDREFCVVRRARTNTPLQALVLLNDPAYVEAARKLAERCLLSGREAADRLDFAFRIVLCRLPDSRERTIMNRILTQAREEFEQDPKAALELLSVGQSPRNESLSASELAAWATTMSVLLNLDESISKP